MGFDNDGLRQLERRASESVKSQEQFMCSNSHTFAIVLKAEFISSSSENWHKKKIILGNRDGFKKKKKKVNGIFH